MTTTARLLAELDQVVEAAARARQKSDESFKTFLDSHREAVELEERAKRIRSSITLLDSMGAEQTEAELVTAPGAESSRVVAGA